MTAERLDWQNMNELHILNVGRADCVVMLLDTPQGRKSVVMDAGGCTFQGKTPLLSFLREREVHTIVLAVLTHLHQDHFGGFFQLIGQIPVKKLLAPCGDLVFDEGVYPIFGDREYYREYIRSSPAWQAVEQSCAFRRSMPGRCSPSGTAAYSACIRIPLTRWNRSSAQRGSAVPA